MPLDLSIQTTLSLPVSREQIQLALEAVLAAPECTDRLPAGSEVMTLRVTDDAEIRKLNFQFRGEDQSTDVLSFRHADESAFMVAEVEDLRKELGDLIMSLPYIRRTADQNGTDLASEFLLCFVHGMLHLLDWDHDTPELTRGMFICQDRILRQIGYRPKRTWPLQSERVNDG